MSWSTTFLSARPHLFPVIDDFLQGCLVVHELVPQSRIVLLHGQAELANILRPISLVLRSQDVTHVSKGGRCVSIVFG